MSKNNPCTYSTPQLIFLTVLRVAIGWHFLYEGLIKVFDANWSARSYLIGSTGPLSTVFKYMATHPFWLQVSDGLNKYGLTLIGISLFLGIATRLGKISGIMLLLLYYFAYPPFGNDKTMVSEGSYWIVNKTLIECFALLVLVYFPTGNITGLDALLFSKKNKQ